MFRKDWRYDKLVDLIESIGYKHRTGNYYMIREHDGYMNISYYEYENNGEIIINFYKNYYHGVIYKNGLHKQDIDESFTIFETFLKFLNKYHNDLFRKLKIKKIQCGIKNSI